MVGRYDEIGVGYARTRQPDPRIAAHIHAALGDAASVVNVGAGAGSYEPADRAVFAIEPSATMVRQRPPSAAPVARGAAEQVPLPDDAVDAALAILTVHHWSDAARGVSELRRVARKRVVFFTWDTDVWESFWLVDEYFPSIRAIDRDRELPIADLVAAAGRAEVRPVLVPHDCIDGFHGAYWRRPAAYLDPAVRAGISTYSLMEPRDIEAGLARLGTDLESGAWQARHRDLLEREELDLGYRLVVMEAE